MPFTLTDLLEGLTQPPVSSALAGILAIIVLILTIVWVIQYQPCHFEDDKFTSLSWDPHGEGLFGGPLASCVFNWHPVLMVGSMVTGTTLAALCYHTPLPKRISKPLHASILFVAFIAMCCGLHAVFKYHDNKNLPDMVSFHSWVGMFSVLIFSAQLTAGAYHFLPGPDAKVPGVNADTKPRYLKLHVTAGILSLVLPVATSGIGIMEKMGFVDRFGTDGFGERLKAKGEPLSAKGGDGSMLKQTDGAFKGTFDHHQEVMHLNFLGLCMILQLIFIVFAIRNRRITQTGAQQPGGSIQESLMEVGPA